MRRDSQEFIWEVDNIRVHEEQQSEKIQKSNERILVTVRIRK